MNPLTKMTITPVLVEQIEKFQSLKPSTAQGLSTATLRLHVSHVQKRVLKLVNFKVQKVQKTDLFDLADTSSWLRDGQ